MTSGPRRKTVVFTTLGACLVALAVALNVSWIIVNWREGLLLLLGIILFPVIITGLVLNTIFLVREVRRNERHDAFINAVTHELKTPVASIRLYLETLERRELPVAKQREFYRQRPPARSHRTSAPRGPNQRPRARAAPGAGRPS